VERQDLREHVDQKDHQDRMDNQDREDRPDHPDPRDRREESVIQVIEKVTLIVSVNMNIMDRQSICSYKADPADNHTDLLPLI